MDTEPNKLINRGEIGVMSFTLTNLLTFLTILSPFMLTFFMIMLSIVNNTIIKGLLFLVGLVIVSSLTYLLKNILREEQSHLASPLCNVLPIPFTSRGKNEGREIILSSPILSSVLLGYISSYLIYPMYINNNVNYSLLVLLVALFGTGCVVEYSNKCGTILGLVLGGIIGITFGMLYYGMIVASGYKDLAYFTEIKSNSQGCSKPSKQKFKCTTYKRGEQVPLTQ